MPITLIGRIVHYGSAKGRECIPAMIVNVPVTAVHPNYPRVGLVIFGPHHCEKEVDIHEYVDCAYNAQAKEDEMTWHLLNSTRECST